MHRIASFLLPLVMGHNDRGPKGRKDNMAEVFCCLCFFPTVGFQHHDSYLPVGLQLDFCHCPGGSSLLRCRQHNNKTQWMFIAYIKIHASQWYCKSHMYHSSGTRECTWIVCGTQWCKYAFATLAL